MHLHHSLRKFELALHDFGVFEVCLLFYATASPNNIAIVEMRLSQGFVDKMQCCWGNKLPDPFDSCDTRGNFFSQLLDMTSPGRVCINEYT